MNIEIANRLVQMRKKMGLSQEQLADKLGLSRQAVSKWERAEASPDTDNLICLAKLYGVSLDELLSTEDSEETIVEEQV
ncbi:MAG: helix-turn-helix transcriptional regulator, partial [Bacilli bacterium]|nr:helix-turn-helix transcriptional regulator [Bacilli bacterium]